MAKCAAAPHFPLTTHYLSTPEYDLHFLILSPEKTCLYMRLKDLIRCQRALGIQLLENAMRLVEAFTDASMRANAIKLVFDVRGSTHFSWMLVLPLVEWMKETKPLFERKLCETHVLLDSVLWRAALRRMIQMAGTARPVHINDCVFQDALPPLHQSR
jgi:hypothetical protein